MPPLNTEKIGVTSCDLNGGDVLTYFAMVPNLKWNIVRWAAHFATTLFSTASG